MCLDNASKDSSRIKWNRNGEITAWKEYRVGYDWGTDKHLFSSVYHQKIFGPGIIKSDRRSKNWNNSERFSRRVSKGIHVFLDKPKYKTIGYIMVPVKCKKSDFVAIGDYQREAVFTEVSISKHFWREVRKA